MNCSIACAVLWNFLVEQKAIEQENGQEEESYRDESESESEEELRDENELACQEIRRQNCLFKKSERERQKVEEARQQLGNSTLKGIVYSYFADQTQRSRRN